jgi:hypothetical protein
MLGLRFYFNERHKREWVCVTDGSTRVAHFHSVSMG